MTMFIDVNGSMYVSGNCQRFKLCQCVSMCVNTSVKVVCQGVLCASVCQCVGVSISVYLCQFVDVGCQGACGTCVYLSVWHTI